MTKEDITRDGLARLLSVKMHQDELTAKALARKLGISPSYLSQLLSGEKCLATAREKLVRQCAEYLGIPAVLAFLWTGKLTSNDFFHEPKSLNERLKAGMRIVSESQYAGEAGVSSADLLGLNEHVQLLLARLFEIADGKSLIGGRVDSRRLFSGELSFSPFEVRRNVTS